MKMNAIDVKERRDGLFEVTDNKGVIHLCRNLREMVEVAIHLMFLDG